MMVINNRQDEMNSWQFCINYRKLNQETHKDHFPLAFIDELYAYSYSAYGSTQDHFHMTIWNVLIYTNAVRTLQRPKHLPKMHDQHLLGFLGGQHGGIVLGHLVSARGIKVDKAKIDVSSSLTNPTSMREVRSFLGHASDSFKILAKPPCLCPSCYRRMSTSTLISLVWMHFKN
ncbi:hypothetical protein CR513_16920, partial [Mucuna pruriens]